MTTPSSAQQRSKAGDEVVEVGHVRHDVVGGDAGRRAVPSATRSAADSLAEEPHHRLDALRPRHLGDVGRRLDAERRDAALDDVLQQVAVVAGDLDHEGVSAEAEALDRRLDVPPGVRDPGVRVGGEVGVLA